MNTGRYISAVIALGLFCSPVKAQRSKDMLAQTIETVVVTGQYTPGTRENAVQKIEVIDRKRIDAMAAQNLRDVLTNQLDIRISQDPIFGASMNLQGSQGYGADAKILIDGVPIVGKQNGAIDLSQINLANIERVEIIKGPMSVSYGTDAIAGTVNLITKKNVKNTWEASANTYYESIGTYNMNAHAGFHKGRHMVNLDGSRNFFGGWDPGDAPSFFNFDARSADTSRVQLWKPREQYIGGLQYIYTIRKTSFNYKGSYFQELITNRGTPLLPYNEMAFDDKFYTYRKDNALFVNSEIAEHKNINILLAYNAYKRVRNAYTKDLTTLSETLTPDSQDTSKYNELNSRGIFTASNKNSKINYEAGYDINIQNANSTQILGRTKQMGNYALFSSAEYKPVPEVTIRPGLRYGYNTSYNAPLVPSMNLMYKADKHWTVRASYAKGFRQPGSKELYFDFVDINHNIHGNTDLTAEYSDNYNVSFNYSNKHGKTTYQLSGSSFYNNVRDLISLALVDGGAANEYTYVNIGSFRSKGMQANAEISTRSLSVSVGASYNGTFNDLSETSAAPRFSYSPEVRSSIVYTVQRYDLSVALFYKYTGRFITYTSDKNKNAVQAFMGDYNIADLTISRSFFRKRLDISAGCKNLFDVKNVSANQAGSGAHSSGSNVAAIGTGRYYFIKTGINLFHQ